jgi:chromosome segregation ATPase
MLQLDSESAQAVNPDEHDEERLQGELAATEGQLRLAEEEILHVRRDLKQSLETLREVGTHARDVTHELDMCRVKLREGRDARRSLRFKLDEAAELLRLRSAKLESSKAEAETSRFRCSQIMFLSVALQERVAELEAELKMLKSTPKYSALSPAHDDSPGAADTGKCASKCTRLIHLCPQTLKRSQAMPIYTFRIPYI